jgi:anti-sigma factor RsiW
MARTAPLTDAEREKLIAYLDGELDEAEARAWEARLEREPQLRAEAEALSRTWAMLDSVPPAETSPTFSSQTLQRVSAVFPAVQKTAPRRPGWLFLGVWVALVVVAGVVGFAGMNALTRPTPVPAPSTPAELANVDELLVRDLRVIENKRIYELVDDLPFLRELAADPDLFGDEN